MADYFNFFDNNNPLNLYNKKPSDITPFTFQNFNNTNEEREARLKEENERMLLELRALIEKEKSQAFLDNLGKVGYDIAKAQKLAELQVSNSRDIETGELRHPSLFFENFLDNFKKKYEDQKEYDAVFNDINNLGKAILDINPEEDDRDNNYVNNFKAIIKLDVVNRGLYTEEDFDDIWDKISQNDRVGIALGALGRKYFSGESLEEFTKSDDQHRFDMLASYMRNNPNYESLASKHKLDINWGDNLFSKDWKAATDHATNRFLYGITGGNGWDVLGTFSDVVGGGVFAAVGNIGNLVGQLVGSAGEYALSRIEGMGFEEDLDKYVEQRANTYINKKSQDLYEAIMVTGRTEEEEKEKAKHRKEIIDEFDKLSKMSSEYRAEQGTSLTELPDEAKIKLFANLVVTAQLYGEEAANKGVQEFWQNHVSAEQSTIDKILRTTGTFGNSMVADIVGFAGVITTPLFMPVDHHNSWNPKDWTVDGEGYSDALVQRNPILTWATNLLETGAWDSRLQDKYKDLGVNALLIYKSVEDLNKFLSWNDFYDIVGQYGFTAATTLMAIGGSGAVKSLSANAAKRATGKGLTSRILLNKEAREALKAGLANGATLAEITAAREVAAQIAAQSMYKGNLAFSAAMGTAEGALEAKSTYNTFIEDNIEKIEQLFDSRYALLDDRMAVKNYMIAKGYPSSALVKGNDGSSYTDFSPEQYALARLELQDKLDEAKSAALQKVEDNAADAAFTNFISNSAINGFLNMFAKEAIMSRDIREASRIMQGKNNYTDLIDVVKKGNKWEAIVKKAVTDNGKRSIWKSAKDITSKALKNAGGEFAEEYSQNLSDLASREALQYDLNQYLGTVFDKESRQAFLTDWIGMLNEGLNSIATNALDLENLKAGVFGALSSMIGGFSPAGIGATFKGFARGRTAQDNGILGTTKWVALNLSNLYQGGIQEAFRDNREEYQTAQRLSESVNAWLNTSKNQELLTHMGGAAGFKKALEEAIIAGDDFTAHDSKLGVAVENAFMLQALKDTDYGKAMLEKILQNAELLEVAANNNGEFDGNGNYIGNVVTSEDGSSIALEDWVSIAINTFKNQLGDATRNTNLTDLLIVERIGQNAQEFIQLLNNVIRAQQRVKNIFKNDNLDPLALQAFVYALMSLENTRLRSSALAEKLHRSININNQNLTEEDKKSLQQSGLDALTINFMVEYGTLELAEKEYKSLEHQANEASEKLNDKKASKEEKSNAKNRLKYLDKEKRKLYRQIAIEKDRRRREEEELTTEDADGETITLSQKDVRTTFSEGDIANMSDQQRAEVISNKEKFSKEQQAIIDNFISISRKTLAQESDDIALSNEEVTKDYIDLAVLQRRANAYDKYLINYINDPSFLSTTAATFREKERTRTLRHLYKEDLLMRLGESVLDFEERLDKKIQSLKELGKVEDARILEKLISENELVSKVKNNLKDVILAKSLYAMLNGDGTENILKSAEFRQMEKALLVVISNSGMSIKKIKDVLDKSDTATIVDFLQKRLADGQYALNKALILEGLQVLDLTSNTQHNEEVLAPVLQKMKEFVDFYDRIKNGQTTTAGTPRPKVVPNASAVLLPSRVPQTPNAPQQPSVSGGPRREDLTLTIIAPGLIDENSTLGAFLKGRGVSQNVMNIDNTRNPNVHFAVIKAYGDPLVFAVQTIPPSKSIQGKTISINGTNYQIIGVISSEESDTMIDLGKLAFSNLLPNEEGKLLANRNGPIKAQFSVLKDPKSVSNQNKEDSIPLKDLLGNKAEAIASWVQGLLAGGKKVTSKKEGSNDKVTTLRDLYGYPVTLNELEEASTDVGKFPIGDSTLEEVIKQTNFSDTESIKRAIQYLKQNEFFLAYFDAWKDYNALENRDVRSGGYIYSKLIGDFIYLGHPYVYIKDGQQELGGKELDLNPRIDSEGYLVIDSSDKNNSLRFTLPANGLDAQTLALLALLLILLNDSYFQYLKPLIGFDIIDNKSISAASRMREAQRLTGLINAGLLTGIAPTAVDREMKVNNPFVTQSGSVRSNNTNASQFDPAPRGIVIGGVVNIEDGTTESGNPQTPIDRISAAINEAQKKAELIVGRIREASTKITQDNPNDSTYLGNNGITYSRVTSAKQAYIGADTEAFNASDEVSNISHAYGNTVDAIIRAALEALNKAISENRRLDKKLLLLEVLKDKAFKGKEHIPNWSNALMERFLNQTITLYQFLTINKEWTIVPKDIRTFGMTDVKNNGNVVGHLPVAGTLDLLAYDKEGKFHIIDIKSIHLTDIGENALDNNRVGWEALVSTYQEMLSQQNPDMEFGENYILPVSLFYSMPVSTVEVEEDGMTVTNCLPSKEPTFFKYKNKDDTELTIEDFLYLIDTLEFLGYEEDRLSEDDRKRIIPTFTGLSPIVPENASTNNKNVNTTSIEGPSTTIEDALTALNIFESKRTVRQARFTEFINNHIAPVTKAKIGIISRAASVVKNLLGIDGKSIILKKELANIFFNGDSVKLDLVLKGLEVSEKSLPDIVKILRNYYSSYILNSEKYIANITKRYQISKAVCEYLRGNITQAKLEEELTKYLATMDSITELLEYMAAPNKEEAATRIINKIEVSKANTQERYVEQLKAINASIESMQAKLDFLNMHASVKMIQERVNSVQLAIDNGSYEEKAYNKSGTIEDILKNKSGSYGATKLLRGIALRTKNGNFKKLANVLLRQIKEKQLTIPITVEDLSLNFVEGSTNGKTITIQKTSLDSYEHFERVLLHEITHAVVEVSPEMHTALLNLLNLAIINLQKVTGKSIEQIKQEHYGFSNVNEFISEFFTNYAFQETLKTIGSNNYSNIFERFVETIKEKFTGDKSLYNLISETMETILSSVNIESILKKSIKDQEFSGKTSFAELTSELQDMILNRGFTKEEFNDMTSIEQEQLKNCCK